MGRHETSILSSQDSLDSAVLEQQVRDRVRARLGGGSTQAAPQPLLAARLLSSHQFSSKEVVAHAFRLRHCQKRHLLLWSAETAQLRQKKEKADEHFLKHRGVRLRALAFHVFHNVVLTQQALRLQIRQFRERTGRSTLKKAMRVWLTRRERFRLANSFFVQCVFMAWRDFYLEKCMRRCERDAACLEQRYLAQLPALGGGGTEDPWGELDSLLGGGALDQPINDGGDSMIFSQGVLGGAGGAAATGAGRRFSGLLDSESSVRPLPTGSHQTKKTKRAASARSRKLLKECLDYSVLSSPRKPPSSRSRSPEKPPSLRKVFGSQQTLVGRQERFVESSSSPPRRRGKAPSSSRPSPRIGGALLGSGAASSIKQSIRSSVATSAPRSRSPEPKKPKNGLGRAAVRAPPPRTKTLAAATAAKTLAAAIRGGGTSKSSSAHNQPFDDDAALSPIGPPEASSLTFSPPRRRSDRESSARGGPPLDQHRRVTNLAATTVGGGGGHHLPPAERTAGMRVGARRRRSSSGVVLKSREKGLSNPLGKLRRGASSASSSEESELQPLSARYRIASPFSRLQITAQHTATTKPFFAPADLFPANAPTAPISEQLERVPPHRQAERLRHLEPEEIAYFDDLVSLQKDAIFRRYRCFRRRVAPQAISLAKSDSAPRHLLFAVTAWRTISLMLQSHRKIAEKVCTMRKKRALRRFRGNARELRLLDERDKILTQEFQKLRLRKAFRRLREPVVLGLKHQRHCRRQLSESFCRKLFLSFWVRRHRRHKSLERTGVECRVFVYSAFLLRWSFSLWQGVHLVRKTRIGNLVAKRVRTFKRTMLRRLYKAVVMEAQMEQKVGSFVHQFWHAESSWGNSELFLASGLWTTGSTRLWTNTFLCSLRPVPWISTATNDCNRRRLLLFRSKPAPRTPSSSRARCGLAGAGFVCIWRTIRTPACRIRSATKTPSSIIGFRTCWICGGVAPARAASSWERVGGQPGPT